MADGGAGERGPGTGGSRTKTFFTSLPGVLTGVATVVTACATIAGVFTSHDGSPPARSAPPATAPATAETATAAPATAPATAPTAGSGGYRRLWGPGPVGIGNDGTDLSDIPPTSGGDGDPDLYDTEAGFGPMDGARLALWHGTGTPTAAQCADLVRTGTSAMGVHTTPGSIVCVRTGRGEVAVIRVVSMDSGTATASTVTSIWAPA